MRPIPQALCLGLIHRFEGAAGKPHLSPARDPVGNWEIGWSHKLDGPHYAFAPITAREADILALADLGLSAGAILNRLGRRVLDLTDGQYAALLSFTYNEGAANFEGSTLARLLEQGDFAGAAEQFDHWVFAHQGGKVVKLPGLVTRRATEKQLFLGAA